MPDLEARLAMLERDHAVLEAQHKHQAEKFESMASKVDEMHTLLMQAKGARWAILGVASLAGFLAGKLNFLTGFIAGGASPPQ